MAQRLNNVSFEIEIKRIVSFLTILLVALTLFSLFSCAFADDGDPTGLDAIYAQIDEAEANGELSTNVEFVKFCAKVNYISSGQYMACIGPSLIEDTFDFSATAEPMKESYETIATVGYMLVIMWSILTITERMQMGPVTYEVVIRWMLQVVLSCLVINYGFQILGYLVSFGVTLANTMNSFVVPGDVSWSSVGNSGAVNVTKFLGLGLLQLITNMLPTIFSALFMFIAIIYLYILVYSALFEIIIRTIFAPIAFADIGSHGLNSSGIRYMRKYLGVCIVIAIYAFILRCSAFVLSVVETGLGGTLMGALGISTIITMITMLGIMSKASGIADSIAG